MNYSTSFPFAQLRLSVHVDELPTCDVNTSHSLAWACVGLPGLGPQAREEAGHIPSDTDFRQVVCTGIKDAARPQHVTEV